MEASSARAAGMPLESRRRLFDRLADKGLFGLTALASALAIALIGLLIYKVVDGAWPAIREFRVGFLWHQTWDATTGVFGALDLIWGTVFTSGVALLFAAPASIAIGLYLSELAPPGVRGVVGSLIEMLAAIPSVVLGLWGILVLGPIVHNNIGGPIHSGLGWLPFFGTDPSTSSVFSATLVLTIMIIPISSSIARDLFTQVPPDLKEGALGLGLTRWEMVRGVVLPYTRGGLVAAVLLGAGRAVGEAIAVTQVIGVTTHGISVDLFKTGDTLASRIASQFPGALSNIQRSSLFYLAVVLLVMALVTNFAAQRIVQRYAIEKR